MSGQTKPILRAIKGEPTAHPPFWLMRQAGRYLPEYRTLREKAGSFLKLCMTPELATEVTLQPIRRFGMDAAILFSDIPLVPHALGLDLAYQDGEGPKLSPVQDRAGLTQLRPSIDLDQLRPVYDAIRLVKTELASDKALIGFAGAPWTLATYVVEGGSSRTFPTVRRWTKEDPDGFAQLIDRLTDAIAAHLIEQIEAGVDLVQIFDSWAGAIADVDLDRWIVQPTRRIIETVKARFPDVPIIGFPKGIGLATTIFVAGTGVDVLSIDPTMQLDFAANMLQPTVALQGNLDPDTLVVGGLAMEQATRAILDSLGGGRFIFNLGHGVLPPTPPQHVADLAEIIRSWSPPRQ